MATRGERPTGPLRADGLKTVLVIPDGAADEPQAELGDRTPLEAAAIPAMDSVARDGVVGQVNHIPEGMPSGSDVGTMSLFGEDPAVRHTGRAPIEAAAQGIELGPLDWAVRCNLVTVHDETMKSFTAEQIDSAVARDLLHRLQSDLPGGGPWEFVPGVSYRNLLLFRGSDSLPVPFDETTETTPPHDITDQPITPHLPSGRGGETLRELMDRSRQAFRPAGTQATQTWLWGQGSAPSLSDFAATYNARAAVITAVDLLRGMGRLLGWDVIEVEGATGYLDTDYAAKGRAAIAALDDYDFVCVHVEATDEASHEGNVGAKVEALERIDADIVAPLRAHLDGRGPHRILVCPDHPTFLRTKTHSHGYVPFAACGESIATDAETTYHEGTAAASGRTLDRGHELMGQLFGGFPAV